MSNFKDTSLQRIYNVDENEKDEEEKKKSSIKTGKYSSMSNSVKSSIDQASRTFEKPSSYTGNRKLYDSGVAKKNVKSKSFSENSKVIDPYTQVMNFYFERLMQKEFTVMIGRNILLRVTILIQLRKYMINVKIILG